jgi:TonB-dependent starch-binding outer membrane protein SusC
MHLRDFCNPFRLLKRMPKQTLLIMKFTVILLFIACTQISAKGFSQTITLSEKNATLKKIFKEINKQTGYQFFYEDELLKQAGKISINVKNATIEQVLSLCFTNLPFTYAVVEKTIVLKEKVEQPVGLADLPPPVVKGTITDDQGTPLQGVSVAVKGTTNGTITNSRGEFSLADISADAVLIFSFIGYESQEVRISSQTQNLRISLKWSEAILNTLVVTGYSSKKPAEITGSVQKIGGNDLRSSVTSANTLAMLKGKASGLYIVEPGGSVANRGQVVMRGQASFNDASNPNFGPLIVLDGVITTAANLQDIVNPNDIESITILKDASSTAIYGSRASQGVMVVVTKRGSSGQPKVNLTMNYGKVQNNRAVRFMNTPELVDHITKYMHRLYDGTASIRTMYGSFDNYFNTTRIFTDADLANNVQWDNKAFFTDGNQSDINLSLSGGTENTKFYTAINWTNQDGTLLDDNLDRRAFRINLDQAINQKLLLSLNANALIDKYTSTASENQYYLFEPFVSPNYSNGNLADSVPNYLYRATGSRNTVYYDNPLYSHSYNTVITKRQNYLGTGKLKYNILPWLFLQSTNTFQYTNNNVNNYKDPRTYRGRYDGAASNRVFINGQIAITDTRTNYFLTSNLLNFNKRYGQHNISALLGQEYGKIHTETMAVSAYNTPYPGERNMGAFLTFGTYINQLQGTIAIPSAAAPIDKASFSVFAEANDNYKDKYFLSASLRRDASTNFGRDNRYGTFYSVGAGWLLTKENFMLSVKPVTNLKVRAAYGTSGREAGADYLNFTVYTDAVRYNTATTTGSTIQRLGNDQITWETTYTTNLGVDIGLWKRIGLSIDLYQRKSANLLQSVVLPSYIGFPSQIRNIGELTNKGVEFVLSTQNIKSTNFNWTTDFNISFNKNTLTKIYGDSLRDGFAGTYYRYVGEDINVLRAIKYVGVNPDNGRPLFERIMPDNKVVIVDSIPLVKQDGLRGYQVVGSATPKFFGGFANTLSYKNITLSFLFNFAYGNKIFNNSLRNFMDPSAWQSGFNIAAPNENTRWWQGPGDTKANYPDFLDLAFFQRGGVNINSSLLYVDASYLRLRNIRLGYDISSSLLKRMKISALNIYVSSDNVFVIQSKELYAADPEGATIGSTSTSYTGTGIASAMPRRFLAGVNVSF